MLYKVGHFIRNQGVYKRTRSKMPMHSRIELELWNFNFLERGENRSTRKKKFSEQSEPATNSTHTWRQVRESNLRHIGGRRVLSPVRHPSFPKGVGGAYFRGGFTVSILNDDIITGIERKRLPSARLLKRYIIDTVLKNIFCCFFSFSLFLLLLVQWSY